LAIALTEALGDDIMERRDAGLATKEDKEKLARLAMLSERDDTLYSWKRAIVAEDDSHTLLGAIIAYPGEGYRSCLERTYRLIEGFIHFDVSAMEDETQAGEFYLDTLAVLPAHRGKGIATALLRAWLERAEEARLTATLACDPHNEKAKRLYESMGLCEAGWLYIFGANYLRMAKRY